MIRFGVVGTGVIVETFIRSARVHEGVSFDAVLSRREETGRQFADKLHIPNVYTDLETMLLDQTLDAIYIASPNSLHYPQAKQALLSGKHVLVEKPFAGNQTRAKELINLAQEKGLILMEAICNIHMPHFNILKENLASLGDIKLIQCNYSQYSSRYDALLEGDLPNVFNPAFSGGALADINIYNIHFVVGLFGLPKGIKYDANVHDNGIDLSGILVLDYGNFKAVLVGAKDSFSKNFGQIQGEKGYVFIEDGVNSLEKLKFISSQGDKEIKEQTMPRLYYELETFVNMVDNNDLALRDVYLQESLDVVKVAQEARRQIGLEFDS